MIRVALDLDDTIFNLRDPMADILNQYTGKNIRPCEWPSYQMQEIYGIRFSEYKELMIRERLLERSRPDLWAHSLIQYLIQIRAHVHVVTHRGWHADAETITRQTLSNTWPDLNYRLTVLQIPEPKSEAFDANTVPHLMFDDSPRVIRDMQERWPECETHMIAHAHNRASGYPGIDLYQARELVKHKHETLIEQRQ